MDIETRTYLKKMIEDAGHAQLVMSVLQRFSTQMSETEVEALNIAYFIFMKEAKEYLEINDAGQLVVTDPEELKKLGLEVPKPEVPAGVADAEDDEPEDPAPAPSAQPATKPVAVKGKKKDYT